MGLNAKVYQFTLLSLAFFQQCFGWPLSNLYFPFINHFFKNYIRAYTEYDFIKNNIRNLLIITAAAWIVGGFYEEIVFRGFIQRNTKNGFQSISLPSG
ncbi:MAG: CPBP family glutamic-type intramembrane protease [Parafilimonas sp.]